MKKRIIIISIILVVAVSVILFIIFNNKDNNSYSKEMKELIDTKVERGEFLGITYSKNLGENDIDSIEVEGKELKILKYKGNKDKIHIDEYKISESDYKDLKSFIDKYNLPAWTNLPVENIDLVEQDSESIVLIYNNENVGGNPYEFYVIDLNKGVKKEYYDYLVKFKKKIEVLLKKENLTISYDDDNNRVEE